MRTPPFRRFIKHYAQYTACAAAIATGVAILPFAAQAQQPNESQRILECVVDNVPGAFRIVDMRVATTADAAAGLPATVTLRIAIRKHQGKMQASARVLEPHDLRDSAYLFLQTGEGSELYYHNPMLNRTRRISGSGAGAALFDTALSFEDFAVIERALRTSSISLRPQRSDDEPNQRRFTVLPPPDSDLPFARLLLDVDTEYCVVVGAELLDHERKVVRRFSTRAEYLQHVADRYWYPTRMRFENPERSRVSEVTVEDIQVMDSLPNMLFDPEQFHRP